MARQPLPWGGRWHAKAKQFLVWAAGYDEGGLDMRSRRSHQQWLDALACQVLRLELT